MTIPPDGARLIIGSDGLFDAVHPKTAAHHTRDMTAAEAAHKLMGLAIKIDKLKDDVTVVVVDFLPNDANDHKAPPCMAMYRCSTQGKKGDKAVNQEVKHLAHPWHPLIERHDTLTAGAERKMTLY